MRQSHCHKYIDTYMHTQNCTHKRKTSRNKTKTVQFTEIPIQRFTYTHIFIHIYCHDKSNILFFESFAKNLF